MTRREAETTLKKIFNIERLYDRQWEAIQKILNGERVLLIEKTGFGKSLCYQFPAAQFKGTTVIFSPLIALMRDQVKALNNLGITARCINSEQSNEENTQIIADAKNGGIKILYIAPERQENYEWIEATRQMNLSMIVIDEAHCISVWGHDFRPAFRRIINLVKLLPKGLPVLATTATATRKVEEDVSTQIGGNITVLRGNLMRENFQLYVIKVNSEDEKLIWLGMNLNKISGTGILYTGTRVNTEIYSKWLEHLKISSVSYNAGLDADSRITIENGLMKNEWKCVVSTNALGMGIDKPDIRFIIHTQIPQSPIHYYQEIGRAGRDGKPTYIVLFYNPKDRDLPEAFIEGGRPSISKYEKVINAVKSELLGERELMKRTNLKQTQVRVIKADLIEQGIIREVLIDKSKKLEYVTNAPQLNANAFEELRSHKKAELESMIAYVETNNSRMKFLCDFLGDTSNHTFNNCDNTGLKNFPSP
jgi:ATP-dependent DNA helicase RecQ